MQLLNRLVPKWQTELKNKGHTVLSLAERRRFATEISNIVERFKRQHLEISLTFGNLLGTVRHFSISPWDDDIDFYARSDQKSQVRHLLEVMHEEPNYQFIDTEKLNGHWKLNILCAAVKKKSKIEQKECPIQVDFFFDDVTHYKYKFHNYFDNDFQPSDFYPLNLRPYDGVMLPVPNKPLKFLKYIWSNEVLSDCKFYNYQKDSRFCKEPIVPCSTLAYHYPMVRRYEGKTTVYELLLKKHELHAVFIHGNLEKEI